jgi:uncharacterized protein (DUF2235 family)
MSDAAQEPGKGRRLIACCDGTWNKPDRQGHTTNVVRLVRSIRACTDDGVSQIVYYHPGVGTGNFVDRWVGGGTGIGLSENVRSVYAWLLDNYRDGDEIFLFGFSRGAYTARSVAGLIAHVGLLRKHHMENFEEVWDYYRQPEKVREKEEEAFLANFPDRVRREDVTIRCIGVFDTVGSMGIPHSGFCRSEYQFHDVILGPAVEYAFHALAIDEQRKPFQPAVWKSNPSPRVRQTVEQVWFPGVHSNIGGGYPEHVLSDATLFWMASRIAPLLELDRQYLAAQAQSQRVRPYAMGKLVDSMTSFYRLFTGRYIRPICETDASEGVHASAFMRLDDTNGAPDPSPYGDAGFRKRLEGKRGRMVPLSDFEKELLAAIPKTEPEKIIERAHRSTTFCDRIITALGGYRP